MRPDMITMTSQHEDVWPMSSGPVRPGILWYGIAEELSSGEIDNVVLAFSYGNKTAGLVNLPTAWVPAFAAIPAWCWEVWFQDPASWLENIASYGIDLMKVHDLISTQGSRSIIVRSSAVGEGLDDRGRFVSTVIDRQSSVNDLIAAMIEIYADFASKGAPNAMALCVQVYFKPDIAGHVSNEVRLSATRNQWKFGVRTPSFAPDRGINSRFAEPPVEDQPLAVWHSKDTGAVLRRTCNWINKRVYGRSHLEWCVSGNQMHLVQWDQEEPTSPGINPHQRAAIWSGNSDSTPTVSASDRFKLHRIQDDPPWQKLKNIRDFWVDADPPRHHMYVVSGDSVVEALSSDFDRRRLIAEIDKLTGGRAVLRTDCKDPTVPRFNLPRTNTVSGEKASVWLKDTITSMLARGVLAADVAFIMHRYIPARAAAWSYFAPGDQFVTVDCLWGLPDGLQFLAHDSYQVDALNGDILSAETRYKRHFLQEQEDGEWSYVQVAREYGRDRVLSKEALEHIAQQSVKISDKIKDQAQIMWFCDIPAEMGLGEQLPWFRSKDYMEHSQAKRPAIPSYKISNLKELDLFNKTAGRFILLLSPEVDLVRDDDAFLDRVIEVALGRDLPVQLDGSTLGHAYYKMKAAGIMVLSSQPKYRRSRRKTVYNKVVRDAIPANIALKGEKVSFGRLSKDDSVKALIGKLFEEGIELGNAKTSSSSLEELADVLEVVRGICSISGVEWKELVNVADKKRENRGGFERQTVLIHTERSKTRFVNSGLIGERPPEPYLTLADIGEVGARNGVAFVPFPRAIEPAGLTINLSLGGRSVALTMRFAGSGIELSLAEAPAAPPSSNPGQLQLF